MIKTTRFNVSDKSLYLRKKDVYIAGLREHELPDWRSQFRALLLKYKDFTLQGIHKDYLADKDKAWHFLDQNELYQHIHQIILQNPSLKHTN